jgi:hypothetical protein
MINKVRNRTKAKDITYILHLCFNGPSLRNAAKALSRFVHRKHTAAIKDWIQKYKSKKLFSGKINVGEFIVDETLFKVELDYV